MTDYDLTKMGRLARVQVAFTPHAPIDNADLFAKRPEQYAQCLRAVFQRGLHIALYGERGVGKTSMAAVLPNLIRSINARDMDGIMVDCNTNDTFQTICRKIFREIGRIPDEIESAQGVDPEDVRYYLQRTGRTLLIVIDELDRMEDEETRSLLADTIKTLSDHSVDATLMLVGVADSIMNLLGDHESIARSVVQVRMPRMRSEECAEVIDGGMIRANLAIDSDARTRIIGLSEGLPHFVHLISLFAAERAVQNDESRVSVRHVEDSLRSAVNTHVLLAEYDRATSRPRRVHLYDKVLLACAYARRDELGYFRPNDVRDPLSMIVGREMQIASFQQHLSDFAVQSKVLQRAGGPRNYRFRFINPLLQAYAKLHAISRGIITEETRAGLEALQRTASDDLFS